MGHRHVPSRASFVMKRSSRSIATGPGSRGGQWHDPEFRKAYFRRWRLEHPEYREWDNERRREAKRAVRLAKDRAWVDELVRA